MIQKKYVAILAGIILLLVAGILYSPYLDWYMIPQKCSDRLLTVVEDTNTHTTLANQFLWFEYEGDNMVLHYLPIASGFSTVQYLDLNENYAECPLEEFKTDDSMAGTFIVMTDEPVEVDLDQDGTAEKVRFIAKTDTNACKTFYGNYHCFAQENIPLEVVVDRTFADVYVYGELFSGDMQMQSSYAVDETISIEYGIIDYISYKDTEAGLMMFTCQYGDETLVFSYIQESNVLNRQHLRAMETLGILLAATVVLTVIMHLVRKVINRKIYEG